MKVALQEADESAPVRLKEKNQTRGNTAQQKLAELVLQMIPLIGENPKRAGLIDTPKRFSKALQFLTSGYEVNLQELIGNAIFDEPSSELVIIRDIEFFSLCEHHILPFFGKVHVAYIPNGKVVGLSKIPRIVDAFARRLQVQERLTSEIANGLQTLLQPKGVSVLIEASHLCMQMRGVEKQDSLTITKSTTGVFAENADLRNEFLTLLKNR